MADRYVIRELEGFTLSVDTSRPRGNVLPSTDVMVLDSWYGYEVAAYWSGEGRGANNGRNALVLRRIYAEWECERLNAESEAAMLAPMQAATVGEDAQATKGKGSR